MKALRALRALSSVTPLNPRLSHRFFAAHSQEPDSTADAETGPDSVFDSSHYAAPGSDPTAARAPSWDDKYRARAEEAVFGNKAPRLAVAEEDRRRALAKALLEAALSEPDDEDSPVKEEDQRSLSVGIVGAPNAGKSALTNYMVGTKVAAVSRKSNTTTHEVLGVLTKGHTQVCFFDTPGLTLTSSGAPHRDVKARVESAWSSVNLYDVVIVIFDVHRHITRPDVRVIGLIKRMGSKSLTTQKRVLCLNKVDLVEEKKDLLKVAEQFQNLPGFDRYFMISGLNGSGVEDLTQYLMDQAVKRPWDEDPHSMSEEVMKNISLEVIRERLLDHVHQEVPYGVEHRLVEWKGLQNGSLRIEHHLTVPKLSQRMILIGKKGSKIAKIGTEAREELRSIFKREVHLILQVKVKVKRA